MQNIVTVMLQGEQFQVIYAKWDNGRRIEIFEIGTFAQPEDCQEYIDGICEADASARVEHK